MSHVLVKFYVQGVKCPMYLLSFISGQKWKHVFGWVAKSLNQ